MYLIFKRILKSAIPAALFLRMEPAMRRVMGLWYAGSEVHCPVCGGHFRTFINGGEGHEALCPRCASLPRNRFLYHLLFDHLRLEKSNSSLIHFSPSRALKKKLKSLPGLAYETADYEPGKEDHTWDLTALPAGVSAAYDLAICFHVLEHIPDDRQAMRELFRILKPGGIALVQTPFGPDPIDEAADALDWTPAERLARFGQEDHVRVYSREGLAGRLREAGFEVEVKIAGEALGEKQCTLEAIPVEASILWAVRR